MNVFRRYLAYFWRERWTMLLGTACSLAGALAISLDTELVLWLVTLPPQLAAVLRWHWP